LPPPLIPRPTSNSTSSAVQTLYDRYLIVDKVSKPSRRIETPQFFWMRVAMGLFLDEKGDRESKAIALY
jgi:ribonucleoside-diphosphate reductase alpha chain